MPPANRTPPRAPRFYVTARQPLRPAAVLLAVLTTIAALALGTFALNHSKQTHFPGGSSTGSSSTPEDSKDDPNQVDTIYLGDAADAPVPATRRNGRAGRVHATVLVRLPRFGDQVGLIPDSPTGHLLYAWLAAFNQSSASALQQILPSTDPTATTAAQLQLRQQTGGFTLVAAKEIQPGLLVFRLHDQTPTFTEALGTLQLRPNSNPPAIATFSLRTVLP